MKRWLLFSVLMVSLPCFAEELTETPPQRWTCAAYDNEQLQWTGESLYEIAAANKALEGCKKGSKHPESCQVVKEQCQSLEPLVVKPQGTWQCTAFDEMAMKWHGKAFPQPDAAALAAKETCKRHSGIPETCYVNLLTCHQGPLI